MSFFSFYTLLLFNLKTNICSIMFILYYKTNALSRDICPLFYTAIIAILITTITILSPFNV
nr:MAG TPA: hypothetical protein [Caudoviricetes sp.]